MENKKIAIGFTIFLEHILPYDGQEEKGAMKTPPSVQLGGGAWNMAKTFESLGVSLDNISVFGISSKEKSADRSAIEFLLDREKISHTLLPVKERVCSSYYLLPRGGRTFAFGDRGGKCFEISVKEKSKIRRLLKGVQIKILAEVSDDKEIISLAELFFEKYHKNQLSVLIPAVSLLRSPKAKKLIGKADVLAFNRKEAELFFGKPLNDKKVLKSRIPYVFITNGPKEAWLKAGGKLYAAQPKQLKNPRFIGGAGDAATAALIYKMFLKREEAESALRFAMEIGRKTLQTPTSYYENNER